MSSGKNIDTGVMKKRLLEEYADLEKLVHEHEHDKDVVELDPMVQGRLSRMDALQGQAMAEEVARRRAVELRRIEAALKRIEEDEFGWCVSCGEKIAGKRLDLDPTVPNCIDCASGVDR